jgi:hypothetical protein
VAWTCLDDRLGAEVVKSHGLEKEIGEVKDSLLKESDEHDTLHVTVQLVYDDLELVCDDLELALQQEMSSLMVCVIQITDRAARALLRHPLVIRDHPFSL